MKKFIHIILVSFTVIVAAALLASYMSVYISPQQVWFLAFFGLTFPYLFVLNVLFAGFWIFRHKKVYWISLGTLLLGITFLFDYIQLNPNFGKENNEKKIRFLSYNVRLFDLYNWSHNLKSRNNIFNYIDVEKPDIICFQEFYNDTANEFSTLDTLKRFTQLKFVHDYYTSTVQNKYFFGIATFSKYPIVNQGEITFENTNNTCIYTDISINNDTVRIYNNHLQSIHFIKNDYDLIDSLEIEIDDSKVKKAKGIIKKLRSAFSIRASQVDKISAHIKKSPYPVIVCGDFNDTPISYTYHTMSEDLIDAFTVSGQGLGTTYSGNLPFIRIDYILHSNSLKSSNYKIDKIKFSDHYPIRCDFEVEKQKKD